MMHIALVNMVVVTGNYSDQSSQGKVKWLTGIRKAVRTPLGVICYSGAEIKRILRTNTMVQKASKYAIAG